MTRKQKQALRKTRRQRDRGRWQTAAGAAAITAPLLGAATVADAELLQYTASIVVEYETVADTEVGDTVSFTATVDTDDVVVSVDSGVTTTSIELDSFDYSVDGSATQIWSGYGGYLRYIDDPNGDNVFGFDFRAVDRYGGRATYVEQGNIYPNLWGHLSVSGDDSIFTSFHPVGMPISLDTSLWGDAGLDFHLYESCIPELIGFATSFNGVPFIDPNPDPDPDPNPCVIADANCDGYVDVGGDIFLAFANFTGPGSFGRTRAEGDVEGTLTGATVEPGPHDGDVDVSDILQMFANFTGPAPLDAAGGLVAASAGDLAVPDLIYDAATGDVSLDQDGAVGMVGYVLNSANGFITGGHTPFMAGVTTTLPYELAEATFATPTGPYPKSIGTVFPTGMDLSSLSTFLTGNQVSRGNNQPIVPFDLVVLNSPTTSVPEPSTAALAASAGLAGLLALKRRRRNNEDGPTA